MAVRSSQQQTPTAKCFKAALILYITNGSMAMSNVKGVSSDERTENCLPTLQCPSATEHFSIIIIILPIVFVLWPTTLYCFGSMLSSTSFPVT